MEFMIVPEDPSLPAFPKIVLDQLVAFLDAEADPALQANAEDEACGSEPADHVETDDGDRVEEGIEDHDGADATAAGLLAKAMGETSDPAASAALQGSSSPRTTPAFDPAMSDRGAGGKTVILVVDDDITTRAMIRSYLEGPDISIFEAVSWREAGLFLRRHRVDGILLDLYLSDLNGIDACRKLHLHPSTRSVPVVLCTSRPSREAVIKGLKAGAADFLIKPFNRDRLIEKLDTVLHSV